MKEQYKKILEETVLYYSENTQRRCVSEDDSCMYNPIKAGKEGISDGCAVSRLLTAEEKQKMEEAISIKAQMENLPEHIIVYGEEFLSDLQNLHDKKEHWDDEELTTKGREWVHRMEQKIEEGRYE